MIDKIQIVSWLLTRRCNLNCSYCGIIDNYQGSPLSYPDIGHYFKQEMSTEYVIETLKKLKKHNPYIFNIFYGGEPLLRKDLPDIINFCNEEDIGYTIITNNSDAVQPMIKRLFDKVDYIEGITSSVDPLILDKTEDMNSDRYKKCVAGLNRLRNLKSKINDIVAEITVDNNNIDYLYDLVTMLTDMGINSDITTIDIAKNRYYDFSTVTDKKILIPKSQKVKDIFQKIIDDKLDVHMSDTLLPKIYDILPANVDCGIEKNVHNMTIDADGSARLCLRIRGVMTPNMKAYDCIHEDGTLHFSYKNFIKIDKKEQCEGCNWTCMIMSKILSDEEDSIDNLIHKEKRDGNY